LWVLLLGLFLLAPVARAGTSPTDVAKLHFDTGNSHYANARYLEALKEFRAGYAVLPNPKFLLNIGQTYRKLGRLEEARASLLEYMGTLGRDETRRASVAQVVAEIDLQLGHKPEPTVAAPAAPTPTPTSPRRRARIVAVALAAAAVVLVAIGAGLTATAVADNQILADPPAGWIYDPSVLHERDRFYPAGLSLFGVGAALVVASVVALVYGVREPSRPILAPAAGSPSLGLAF
jgi:hypothetical protein